MCAVYDPALYQAPIVVGHPTDDAPAYGWLAALRYDPVAQAVEGVPAEIDPDFAAAHRAGRLRYHSLSLYLPDSAANPKPGHLYPRHLGFLGATPPAIKGLRRANFAAADPDTLTLTFTESPGAPMPDPKTPTPPAPAPAPAADPDLTAQFAEREAHLSARERELEARAATLAQAEAERARAAWVSFAEALVAQGRLLPRDSAPVATLLASLAADAPAQVDFAEPATDDNHAIEMERAVDVQGTAHDEQPRALGRAGEERVLAHERAALKSAGRDDLADLATDELIAKKRASDRRNDQQNAK